MTYILLDESGDLGFSKKSSKYFLVTVLTITEKKHLEKLVKKVHSQLRKHVKRIGGGNLHAHKEKPETRKKLLTLLSAQSCSAMLIVLNKSHVYSQLRKKKHLLYNYVTNMLLDRIISKKLLVINNPIQLIAAKRETNLYLNANFKQYLESQIRSNHHVDITIKIATPSEEKSLQAVDFVSWACYRKYEYGDEEYYNLTSNIIVEENSLYK